jgi:hypothetical protein
MLHISNYLNTSLFLRVHEALADIDSSFCEKKLTLTGHTGNSEEA